MKLTNPTANPRDLFSKAYPGEQNKPAWSQISVRLEMFKRSINYPQIYQSLTPGKSIVISFLSNNVISSMKC